MATVIQTPRKGEGLKQAIGQGIGNFVQKTAEGYQTRADEMALQKAVGDLGPKASPQQILQAITGTHTYSPAAKQNALKNYVGVAEFEEASAKRKEAEAEKKAKIEQEKGDALANINASDKSDEEKAKLINDVNEGKISYKGVKDVLKPSKGTTSEFEKGLAKENVKQYVEASKSIVQAERNLKDLDRIEELDKKLRGPLGYVSAYNPLNEDAAEMSALGFGVIEPIVKIFNPSGPIAQKKLEQLQNRYGIQATDSSAKIRGKVSALKRYANYAKEIANKRIALFQEYNGNPPIGEIARLDTLGNDVVDQMAKEDPTEPTVYYSTANGKPIIAKSLEQQQELLDKGLITDVKPK